MMNNILNSFIWGAIKNRLQSMGIPTDGINFNDMNSLNDFAKNILPWLLKGNPQAKEMIKQNIGNLDKEAQDEVVKVIDGI